MEIREQDYKKQLHVYWDGDREHPLKVIIEYFNQFEVMGIGFLLQTGALEDMRRESPKNSWHEKE